MENQVNQPAAQDAVSYTQDSAQNSTGANSQNAGQGGMLNNLTSGLNNIQMPQAVKDFGATCARSYNSLSTTQKVIGGAALALGASYLVANNQGWIGQAKSAIKGKASNTQHS
ncbi:hypothetical protein EFA69_12340 [Rufibacter immobilis]|uniref:Uncharacterized protein n=1 Tax=Rufibacter immobilis TaxID=1348778 RepID=A0A3M9MXJ8_9BACT|nr:hypothetical protein [Rufibacter immobilis]RNI30271.1 hypothetical protein EFA69_12340 [Rufibacter immobilis]